MKKTDVREKKMKDPEHEDEFDDAGSGEGKRDL
jgi:hypothetical protein